MQSGSTPAIEDKYKDLNTPSVADQQLQLEQLVQQGTLSPEQAQVFLQGPSDMNNVSTDPRSRQAQMDALAQLQDITNSGGLTAIDKAKLGQIFSDEDTKSRGARESIIQNAQARGMGGSGLDLMAQLQNSQDSATRASQRGMDVAAQAQQNALNALMQQGQLGNQISDQTFNQAATKANANDAISKFNAQNQQSVALANTAAQNAAQATNLANKQSIANQNVGLANSQQQYNKELLQKEFDNQVKKAGGQSGVATQNAANAGKDSQSAADATNKMIGTGITSLASLSDEREKKDIKEIDPSDFLDNITGYKFKYKNKSHGDGEKMGVMAQDLLKSDSGSELVSDSPDGLVVDYGKAGPQMMASLANLNERLRKIEGDKS